MLKHAKGNLIDLAEQGLFDVIVHGCNCQNTMGSGIAKEIRERYPQAYEADSAMIYTYQKPVLKLGNFSVAADNPIDPKFEIVNAYTQLHYLPRGVDHFDYESFKLILRKLAVISPDARYGFPYIGMGLAGGDPDEIKKILWYFSNAIERTGGSATLVEFSG
jgi:O-acetyl-ADP-ribose deacetylase (regulator of RNase III)